MRKTTGFSKFLLLAMLFFVFSLVYLLKTNTAKAQGFSFNLDDIIYFDNRCNYPNLNWGELIVRKSAKKNSLIKLVGYDGSGEYFSREVMLYDWMNEVIVGINATNYDIQRVYVYRLNSYGSWYGTPVEPLFVGEVTVEKYGYGEVCEDNSLRLRINCTSDGATLYWKNLSPTKKYGYSYEIGDGMWTIVGSGGGTVSGQDCNFEQGRTCKLGVSPWPQKGKDIYAWVNIAGEPYENKSEATCVVGAANGNGGNGYVQPTPTSPPPPPSCSLSCGRTKSCGGGLTCYANPAWKWWFNQGVCRNASCLTDTDCVCAVSPPPPTPTTPPSTPTPTPTTGPTVTPIPCSSPNVCVDSGSCTTGVLSGWCPRDPLTQPQQFCCRPTPIPTPVGYHRFCPI